MRIKVENNISFVCSQQNHMRNLLITFSMNQVSVNCRWSVSEDRKWRRPVAFRDCNPSLSWKWRNRKFTYIKTLCIHRCFVACLLLSYQALLYRYIYLKVDHSHFPSNWTRLLLNWCQNSRLKYVHDLGTMHSFFFVAANFKICVVPGSVMHFKKQSGFHSNTTHFLYMKKWWVVYLDKYIVIMPILSGQLWLWHKVPVHAYLPSGH